MKKDLIIRGPTSNYNYINVGLVSLGFIFLTGLITYISRPSTIRNIKPDVDIEKKLSPIRFVMLYLHAERIFKEFPIVRSRNPGIETIPSNATKTERFHLMHRYVNLYFYLDSDFEEKDLNEVITYMQYMQIKKGYYIMDEDENYKSKNMYSEDNTFSFFTPTELVEVVKKKFPFIKSPHTQPIKGPNSHTRLIVPFYKYEHLKILRFIELLRIKHHIDYVNRI
jgi:hypothetical protein